ncbi:sarcosine oxidase subunit delta [Leisingera methylohalidivorans]|uniref:Sarcosine oxidase subunit delta n=1 Tax=Leisingera methylohalidivorans DSM 14336 TaxID=999552 RepID=V9VUW5_9RHOB|nr:sarcosine oxidase subunit delta [Leisingera methylohalidivorans]AHD01499.1 sarcosine oxidase subunit delta [Leisingera methylohalidivorans DSM 14336]
MRIACPLCGERDRREFYYKGAALVRPAAGAGLDAWHEYVNLRENPAGPLDELWYHEMGCNSWLKVTRDTATHEILAVQLAAEAGLGGEP